MTLTLVDESFGRSDYRFEKRAVCLGLGGNRSPYMSAERLYGYQNHFNCETHKQLLSELSHYLHQIPGREPVNLNDEHDCSHRERHGEHVPGKSRTALRRPTPKHTD